MSYYKVINIDPTFVVSYIDLPKILLLNNKEKEAMKIQQELAVKLNDTNIMKLRKNTIPWYVVVNGKQVILYELKEKQCYVYYSMALITYLLGKYKESMEYINKSKKLKIDRKQVIELIDKDLSILKNAPHLKDGIDKFRIIIRKSEK